MQYRIRPVARRFFLGGQTRTQSTGKEDSAGAEHYFATVFLRK